MLLTIKIVLLVSLLVGLIGSVGAPNEDIRGDMFVVFIMSILVLGISLVVV